MKANERRLVKAALLAVGSELTHGETRDTNSGFLAASLTQWGVEVVWAMALPDRLETVVEALRSALAVADLVVTTGGLGPTPDDLTREAIAAVCGERPTADLELGKWLRNLFERRGMTFPDTNLKQAWLIPSARALANDHGTAPGWWVDRPEGQVIVALPGPPREMTAMWENAALPALSERGLGETRVTRTFRITGLGESLVAAKLGEELLRRENPVVATYARQDAVDVRVSARDEAGEAGEAGRTAQELADEAAAAVTATLGEYIWGHDGDTWSGVLGALLSDRDLSVAVLEVGTGGTLLALLGEAEWLAGGSVASSSERPLASLADEVATPDTIGLAVRARESGADTAVELAAAGPWGIAETSQIAFLTGTEGRHRAAIAAVAFLRRLLLENAATESDEPRDAAGSLADNSGPGIPTSRTRSGS